MPNEHNFTRRSRQDLLAELNKPEPAVWRPTEPGDSIIGVVARFGTWSGRYGDCPVVTLDVDGAEVEVRAAHQVLQSQLERARPRIGDVLAVRYLGKPAG